MFAMFNDTKKPLQALHNQNKLAETAVVRWEDLSDEELEARISKESGSGGNAGYC
jgi:hypothetical protein